MYDFSLLDDDESLVNHPWVKEVHHLYSQDKSLNSLILLNYNN
uniref:Uncharacterized protein n=1 Tax=Meloidogyne enterolobii TaxID=390850 RepID=A0A6V7XLB2_MELEN|nr:unnamed protein product [Meloidogyne enterolobii]